MLSQSVKEHAKIQSYGFSFYSIYLLGVLLPEIFWGTPSPAILPISLAVAIFTTGALLLISSVFRSPPFLHAQRWPNPFSTLSILVISCLKGLLFYRKSVRWNAPAVIVTATTFIL